MASQQSELQDTPSTDGEQPNELELWKITHERPNGKWADEKSRNCYEEMVKLVNEPQSSPIGDGDVHLTPREALKRVVGERSGHARGMGCGPKGARKYGSNRYTQEEIDQLMNEKNQIAKRLTNLEDAFEARVQATVTASVSQEVKTQVDEAVRAALAQFMELSRGRGDSSCDASP